VQGPASNKPFFEASVVENTEVFRLEMNDLNIRNRIGEMIDNKQIKITHIREYISNL